MLNPKWIFGLLIYVIGNILVPPPPPTRDNLYECLEPGCTRRFMTANGRSRHIKRVHQGARNTRTSCKHGCGKTYAYNKNARLHERTCERNPNR